MTKENIMKLSTAANFFSKKILLSRPFVSINQSVFENCYWILSYKVYVSNINNECDVNASETTPWRCSILKVL